MDLARSGVWNGVAWDGAAVSEVGDGTRAPGPDDVEVELDVLAPDLRPTFAALYREQFLPLVRLATLVGAGADTARDVVQDAFVRLHLHWATVRDPLAYVRRSVVNGCRSHHRRERRAAASRRDADEAVQLEVDHTLAALAVLPHRQRAAIVLKYYEARTEQEIADVLGCRPGSVGPMVHRALATMREALS